MHNVDTPTASAAPAGLFSPAYRALTVGLVAIVTLVAFEALAVVTVMPEIEDDLGGLAWYGWVTTAFFLGTMTGIVFAGDQPKALRGVGQQRPVHRAGRRLDIDL